MARAYCYRCFKTARLCVCDVVSVQNHTPVWIVQHPAERQHPINTARLTALGLERSHIDVAWNSTLSRPSTLPPGAAVLFPSESSRDLATLREAERPDALVVIDGTWSQARKLYVRNDWIRALPHVHLEPSSPSRYRIRRQPREGYLSTLEATVAALRLLEPETTGLDRLLRRFDAMIETQAQFIEDPPPGAYRHMRAELPGRPPRPPRSITAERLVLCYGDFLASRSGAAAQPVTLCLERPHTGERVTFVFRGEARHPTDIHLEHMGLSRDDYDAAPNAHAARAAIRGFLHEEDALCAWNAATERKVAEVVGRPSSGLSLKSDYCNWSKTRCGHLEALLDTLAPQGPKLAPRRNALRAEQRLAQAVAVFRWLERDVAAVLQTYA